MPVSRPHPLLWGKQNGCPREGHQSAHSECRLVVPPLPPFPLSLPLSRLVAGTPSHRPFHLPHHCPHSPVSLTNAPAVSQHAFFAPLPRPLQLGQTWARRLCSRRRTRAVAPMNLNLPPYFPCSLPPNERGGGGIMAGWLLLTLGDRGLTVMNNRSVTLFSISAPVTACSGKKANRRNVPNPIVIPWGSLLLQRLAFLPFSLCSSLPGRPRLCSSV